MTTSSKQPKLRHGHISPQDAPEAGRRTASSLRHRPRATLWAAAGVVTLGFLVALELAARRYGTPGPITNQVRELVFAPKSGGLLYAAMALTMVVLTWRQRLIAAVTAIGIDLAFLVGRWALDVEPAGGHPFGNGALWVIVGVAVLAVTRRTGPERVLLLKGAGLGLLLMAGRKTGDTWLLITSKTRPMVLDPYVAAADHALGNPSWLVGRVVEATGSVGFNFLDTIYGQLPVAAVVVALYQLRHVAAERRFPRHHLVRSFLVIGLLGPAFYMIYPVVGPLFAYGTGTDHWASISLWAPEIPSTSQWAVADLWPRTPPPADAPHPIPFDGLTPRNCMPSLHTAWATAIFIHSARVRAPCGSPAPSGWSPPSRPPSASATTTAPTSSPAWCSCSRSRPPCARTTAAGTGRGSGWSPTARPSSPRSCCRTASWHRRWPTTPCCTAPCSSWRRAR